MNVIETIETDIKNKNLIEKNVLGGYKTSKIISGIADIASGTFFESGKKLVNRTIDTLENVDVISSNETITSNKEQLNNDINIETIENISEKLEIENEVKTWRQTDDRWKNIKLGNSLGDVNNYGCLATCAAIQFARSGANTQKIAEEYSSYHTNETYPGFNPGTCIEYLNNHEGFDDFGIMNLKAIENADPTFSYETTSYWSNTNNLDGIKESIKQYTDNGKYIILEVEGSGYNTHYIAVTGIDENNNITIIDPATESTTLDSSFNLHKLYFVYNRA